MFHKFDQRLDTEAIKRESDLAAACVRSRADVIRAQAFGGNESAVMVWGALICMERKDSLDNRLGLCNAFNLWAGKSAGPQTIAEMQMLQGQIIPADENPTILIDHHAGELDTFYGWVANHHPDTGHRYDYPLTADEWERQGRPVDIRGDER